MTATTLTQVSGILVIPDGILAILEGLFGEIPSRGWTVVRDVIERLIGKFVFSCPADW